ncbi:MAG: tyrosine recombinase XerC [Oscillospiraceae bacterium]|jgi:site-specific recombinase XerD|nr:tyrosine recombinase XerC [Oscillospiraceae bacterium]
MLEIFSDNNPILIRRFLTYILTIKGKSENTALEYFSDLKTFFRFIKQLKNKELKNLPFEKVDISDIDIDIIRTITLEDIYDYLNYTRSERRNNAATRARKVSSLKSFFKYLTVKTNKLEKDPTKDLDTPKIKSTLPKFLSLNQCVKLLKIVDGPYKERDYCMLTLFLNCGMRLSELVGINLEDIENSNALRIVGKGNKERMIYLNKACILAINAYKKVRPVNDIKDKNALFISKFKKRISRKTVQYIVYKYLDVIGVKNKGYSVHKLRHTAATLMYQHGNVDIRILKEILGHKNLGTTEIYTHISNKQIKDALNANPLSTINI